MAERRCLDGDTVRPCPVAALDRAYWRRRALHAEEAGADLMAQIAAGLRRE